MQRIDIFDVLADSAVADILGGIVFLRIGGYPEPFYTLPGVNQMAMAGIVNEQFIFRFYFFL